MKVALLGRTRILYESINKIIDAGHEIVLIGTCVAAPEYDIKETDFEYKAKEIGAFFFNDAKINSDKIVALMKSSKADIAISINWLTIIEKAAVSCFKYGILNAHCGDLPRYRGNACPNWSILVGDNSYAISIHYMTPGELDSGDILIKKHYPIDEKTTITDIYDNMNSEIPLLFCDAVNLVEKGNANGIQQSKRPEDSLRCYPRIPTDSFIEWNENCEQIIRNINASTHPFQGAFCFWNETKIYIFAAEKFDFRAPCYVYPGQVITSDKRTGEVEVAAADGIIRFKSISINGEEYRAADILKSTRIRLNYCEADEIYKLKMEIKQLKGKLNIIEEQMNVSK